MKKGFLVSAMVVLLLMLSSTSVLAKEEAQPIKVYVDGVIIEGFHTLPLNDNGTTLVQFKPVFEKLGLKVTWDQKTQTVTGTTYDLNIQLTLGSKTVLINGEKKQLAVAPKLVHDVTMVPLRFVGEASGRDVSWDGRTQTVYIASTKDQILHLINQSLIYSQTEDLAGYMSTLDPNTPGIEQVKVQIGQINAAYELKYAFEDIEITSIETDKATVKLTQQTTKVAGPEFGNSKVDLIMNLIKINGEWKLTTSKILKIDYLNQDLLKESKITLSEADQTMVLAVLEKNRVSVEKEDLAALKSTYDPTYPDLDATLAQLKQLFAAFDLKVEVTNIKFIENSADEVKVYSMSKLTKVKGPEFPSFKSANIDTLKKNKDGEWKIIKSDDLSIEYIQ
jgi:hypothetical protein